MVVVLYLWKNQHLPSLSRSKRIDHKEKEKDDALNMSIATMTVDDNKTKSDIENKSGYIS